MSINLTSDRLILRALEPEDLSFLYQLENNENVWEVSNTLVPYSKYVLKQYIENSNLDIYTTKQLRLIIELKDSQQAIGAIDLFDFDPYHNRAGIGIVIDNAQLRNHGYATEALKLLVVYCFHHLKLHQVYCNIGQNNNASIKLFESVGFVLMATKHDWLKTIDGWENELSFQLLNNYQNFAIN